MPDANSPVEVWDCENGQPPPIESLIGLEVVNAWVLPSCEVMLLFAGGTVLKVGRLPSAGVTALCIETGRVVPGADFSDMKELEAARLRGLVLDSLAGSALMFHRGSEVYGLRISVDGLALMKRQSAVN